MKSAYYFGAAALNILSIVSAASEDAEPTIAA
jgi:hypothetical protein